MNCLKTVILCILIFFGAAFTIMAFNNDVGVTDVFAKFYQQITGMIQPTPERITRVNTYRYWHIQRK